ncbi:c-type cytochrome [Deinococcus soli (ex Cha et al. 2016)]|uniref:Cytochrome c553 n=2 Tax=Deinococcus soli (ex Cha et al. 2016) TaxID=1309411 RepID=A0ACC6KBQ2_9DEIO|nr:c-type cytochrome [Deinococcus soli (ex Cha et al. 2016)]MDR6216878.1 cytochrome c553 [Deinococcus soli (ex Cha et al. 2016)]MDR6327699.1 cytochrome c553 [Deinococcus soli (ex Cha et al. 2016)]MDR6749974.1 cytochrome c553 [Deinococcus soli (ex Cha et al. 2016)]
MNRRSLPAALLLVTPLLAGVAALAQTTPAQPTPAQTTATTLKAGPADPARGEAIAASCSGCHGPTGRAPVLKGEPAAQIQNALLAFRSGTRRNGTMQGIASRMSDQDIVDVAAFYAGPPPTPAPATPPVAPTPAPPSTSTAAPTTASGTLGRTLYLEGAPGRDVLACAVCHGEDGKGADAVGIPAIAGLSAASVLETLRAYHAMPPVGIAYPDAMRIAVKPLTDADMNAVAQFVATLK